MGNIAKPAPLLDLERSIWLLVLSIAKGASVYQLLPVYLSYWGHSIDDPTVTACKSWLDDFGVERKR